MSDSNPSKTLVPRAAGELVHAIANRWGSASTGTDSDRITEAVRAFILKHGARFQTNNDSQDVPNRAGA